MRCEADAETPATLKKLKYASRRRNNNNNNTTRRTRTDRHTKLASLELRAIWTDNRAISPHPTPPLWPEPAPFVRPLVSVGRSAFYVKSFISFIKIKTLSHWVSVCVCVCVPVCVCVSQ